MKDEITRICVVGAPNAGVRHFTAVLALSLVDLEGTQDAFYLRNREERFEVDYYRNKFKKLGQLLPPSYAAPTFHFQWYHRRRVHLIELFCLSGEQFLDPTRELQPIDQLLGVTGLLFLVDPLNGFKKTSELAALTSQLPSAFSEAQSVLRRLINCLQIAEGVFHQKPLQTPVALVYSKSDFFPNWSPAEVESQGSIALRNLKRIYEANFQKRWQGCACALGPFGTSGKTQDFRPVNVLEPFFWFLHSRQTSIVSPFFPKVRRRHETH